eukprot:2045029-Pleurochrysis_carterae.AAC.1
MLGGTSICFFAPALVEGGARGERGGERCSASQAPQGAARECSELSYLADGEAGRGRGRGR